MMLEKLAAKRINGIETYSVNETNCSVRLDCNESPWYDSDSFRMYMSGFMEGTGPGFYPEDSCRRLKAAIAGYVGAAPENIIAGNGSDQLIGFAMQAFINEGDCVVVHAPTFSMYEIYAMLCGGTIAAFEAGEGFKVDMEGFRKFAAGIKPKMLVVCNPNNPTGAVFEPEAIRRLVKGFDGIVLLDEAYYEFSGISCKELLGEFDNLIILRTFSKAFGLAGLRVGYAIAGREAVSLMEKARPPYNLNSFSQAAALWALSNPDKLRENVEKIVAERERMRQQLLKIKGISCFPSSANFLLVEAADSEVILKKLRNKGIAVKSFGRGRLEHCLRITVGAADINDIVVGTIGEVCGSE